MPRILDHNITKENQHNFYSAVFQLTKPIANKYKFLLIKKSPQRKCIISYLENKEGSGLVDSQFEQKAFVNLLDNAVQLGYKPVALYGWRNMKEKLVNLFDYELFDDEEF